MMERDKHPKWVDVAAAAFRNGSKGLADALMQRTSAHARIERLEQTIADAAQPRPVEAGHVCTRFRAKWGGGVECMDCGKGAADG